MSSVTMRAAWLEEHFGYEVDELRRTIVSLQRAASANDQATFNMAFVAFVVHARNLGDFLKNAKDNRNFNAANFVGRAYAATKPRTLDGVLNQLHQQVVHMGKQRVKSGPDKVTLSDCARVECWIETELPKFRNALSEELKVVWCCQSNSKLSPLWG